MGKSCLGSEGGRSLNSRAKQSQGKHVRQAYGKVKRTCGTAVRVPRDSWSCFTCGIGGVVGNEFHGESPFAHHDKVVVSRGAQTNLCNVLICFKCLNE